MRTTPLLGKKLWFGPRRFGWGLSPVSIEGWSLTAALVVVDSIIKKKMPGRRGPHTILGLVFLAIAMAKGTSPGGPRAWKALRAAQA